MCNGVAHITHLRKLPFFYKSTVAASGSDWATVAVTKRAKNNTDGWTMGAVVGRDETQPEDWRWGYDTVPFVIPLSYAPKWRNNNLFRFSTRF